MQSKEEIAVRIAIATEGSIVCPHFGHTPHFTFVDIEDGAEKGRQVLPNPGHAPGALPRWMSEMGVNTVIAGGVGAKAQALLNSMGIDFIMGAAGEIEQVVKAFVEGALTGGDSTCHHEDGSKPSCGSCS